MSDVGHDVRFTLQGTPTLRLLSVRLPNRPMSRLLANTPFTERRSFCGPIRLDAARPQTGSLRGAEGAAT